ncbi:FMN-binding glutamate synthase family protein [Methylocella silvestris]|uniref:FMN-binding glutamate synthase family protein n=1 Tax=Methylocella silvestris TaxID=199596 RepID=A0A2J7TES6_METSI|nr:FMN-binding glutamate synthase family protein [Methylocella silvestris]PNG25276.1 FMN-binding glutamate synthase family protein [Methylocella silvestris]
MTALSSSIMQAVDLLSTLFVFALGCGALALLIVFVLDRRQTRDAILRNYPVIGHLRYIFSNLGEFFRQYFFAMDRDELPFNRAERNWVERASKDSDSTVAFGSTKYIRESGTPIFVNCPYPTLDEDVEPPPPFVIGPDSPHPYLARSFFNISGMSFGALSGPAVLALSKGARMAGCWMNTGEGGLSSYHLEGGADIIFQIGTAKYGVRHSDGTLDEDRLREVADLPQVKMFEIKLSQGAKPGKGGILPAVKVTPEIAGIRGIPVGEDSISPNRHPEINSNDELLDFIERVKTITQKPVGVKAVLGAYGWLDDLMAKVLARGAGPDFFTLDSGDGGTGAAPMALMDNVGLPIRESLPLVRDIIKSHGLAERIPIIASGKLTTPADVAWALCAGATFVNSARGFMFALGCIQSLKCNKNTCPTGVTTHDKRLQKGLDPADKAVRVANYCRNLRRDVEVIAHSCGVSHPRRLKRFHVRIVCPDGVSRPLSELYPTDDPADSNAAAARRRA